MKKKHKYEVYEKGSIYVIYALHIENRFRGKLGID